MPWGRCGFGMVYLLKNKLREITGPRIIVLKESMKKCSSLPVRREQMCYLFNSERANGKGRPKGNVINIVFVYLFLWGKISMQFFEAKKLQNKT